MAIVTRVNGDSTGVPGSDVGVYGAYVGGTMIQTGIGKRVTAYKILTGGATTFVADFGVGGAVEAVLRVVSQNATVIAYQGETANSTPLSVFVEASSWDDAGLQAAIRALGTVNSLDLSAATAVSTGGLRLA